MSIRDYISTGNSDLLAKIDICFDSDIQGDEQVLTSEMLQGVINYIIKNDGFDPMPLKGYVKFPNLSPKSKFKTGDKVKITKDFLAFISGENVNLKGFEGVVLTTLNLVSGMYNQNSLTISYDVDVNGFIVGSLQESDLELIEQPQKLEYRKDLYDIADDVDGCLLPDYQPKTELIQRKIS